MRPLSTPLSKMTPAQIRDAVAERYSLVADAPGAKIGFPVGAAFARAVGYDPALLDALPAALTDSFTGAGNPQPFIDLGEGEAVLDLGCGAGLDLLHYARLVGPTGKVIGLDLSPSMLAKARANLASQGVTNGAFLHAPADAIPLPDSGVDLVTANGIFNLAPDKDAVMREAHRVLRKGGRLIFAEIVLRQELPAEARRTIDDWFRCIGGALPEPDMLDRLASAGFRAPRVLWTGRNARTGHPASISAVIRAEK